MTRYLLQSWTQNMRYGQGNITCNVRLCNQHFPIVVDAFHCVKDDVTMTQGGAVQQQAHNKSTPQSRSSTKYMCCYRLSLRFVNFSSALAVECMCASMRARDEISMHAIPRPLTRVQRPSPDMDGCAGETCFYICWASAPVSRDKHHAPRITAQNSC